MLEADVHQTTSGFWREDLWLPPNVTWQQTRDTHTFPFTSDLLYSLPIALALLVLRWIVEMFVATPIGLWLGIVPDNAQKLADLEWRNRISRAKESTWKLLRTFFLCYAFIEAEAIAWNARRKQIHKLSVLQKFRETGWRFLFYTFVSIYGLAALWNKSWFWDISHCWDDILTQHVPVEIWWYYMIEIGFNISVFLTQIVMDNKRKDFWMAVIHHVVSFLLLSLSWLVNGVRIGSLVLICHDVTDPLVEIAKGCIYVGRRRAADIAFAVFTVGWIILRVGVYPFHLVLNSYLYGLGVLGPLPAWTIFFIMVSLVLMHFIWTVMIIRMAYNACKTGQVEDTRSDTDEDRTEDLHQLEKYFQENKTDEGISANELKSRV